MTDKPREEFEGLPAGMTRTHVPAGAAGSSVGPYRLLERLGEGGMGEVWLAEQVRPVRRQVALKLVKAGLDTAQVVARFEAERQALALMDHPSIAKVFDAGSTDLGRPYFAMEYVRGESITTYCDRHRLTIAQRLELFIHVCDGVQHAHQKGIIHRDLKPSNILVAVQDDRSVPKIIDFGVAKATSQPLTEHTLYTSLGGFVGTLEYISPEQAEMGGVDVDTRTDVYALGVTLYELLTGVLPFDRRQSVARGVDDVRRTIREVDPSKPSTRVMQLRDASAEAAQSRRTDAARLPKLLQGDLDWITIKALEKERPRRYATASDLAADLERHLRNEPVLASPPSTLYRIHKFIRRNRAGVAAAITLVLILVLFAGAMAAQARRIALERDRANLAAARANTEAATAKQVSEFLVGLFTVSDPSESRGNTLTARELLDRGADRIERDLAEQPEVQARLQGTIGKVYSALGLYRNAEVLLTRALFTNRQLTGSPPETFSALNSLAEVYWHQGRYSESERMYAELVKWCTATFGTEDRRTLRAQFDLASTYQAQKRYEDAERAYRDVLAVQARVLGEEHVDTIDTVGNLAGMFLSLNRPQDARPLNARVLQTRRRDLGPDHPETLNAMISVAATLIALKEYQSAEALLLEMIPLARRVLGESHPRALRATAHLGNLYFQQGRYEDAEQQLMIAYEGFVRTLGEKHEWTQSASERLRELWKTTGKPAKITTMR